MCHSFEFVVVVVVADVAAFHASIDDAHLTMFGLFFHSNDPWLGVRISASSHPIYKDIIRSLLYARSHARSYNTIRTTSIPNNNLLILIFLTRSLSYLKLTQRAKTLY